MVRVQLPYHLQTLARCGPEVALQVAEPVSQRSLLKALEASYPGLAGTVVDPASGRRRPMIRFFACREDLSHQDPEAPLPAPVRRGEEPFLIVGAIAGG